MKNLNVFKKHILFSFLTATFVSCVVHAAGGSGPGGGNLKNPRPHRKPYREEIKRVIAEIKPIARVELNQLKNLYSCDPSSCSTDPFMLARARLLNDPEKTRKLIDSVVINILDDKPCDAIEDGQLKQKAASATLPNNICFSLSEIEKYDVSTERHRYLDQSIRGLFFHELVHLRGGDESEANIIQTAVSADHSSNDSINAIWDIERTQELLERVKDDLNLLIIKTQKESVNDTESCSQLQKIVGNAVIAEKVTLSEQDNWLYGRLLRRVNIATVGYCEESTVDKSELLKVFNGAEKISELSFELFAIQNTYKNSELTMVSEMERAARLASETIFFRNLSNHSRSALLSELQTTLNELNILINSIEQMKLQ